MAAIYLLDSGPLGLLAHNRPALRSAPIQNWVLQEIAAGSTIYVPEVADYEVRRELTRLIHAGQLRRPGSNGSTNLQVCALTCLLRRPCGTRTAEFLGGGSGCKDCRRRARLPSMRMLSLPLKPRQFWARW